MFRKSFLSIVFVAVATVVINTAAYAQTAPLGGSVSLQKEGKAVPVAGALVEVYRTDMKGFYSTKTDKRGEFRFAGVLYGEYVISVSAPECSPALQADVKAGQEAIKIAMQQGDGRKYTEAEAKSGATRTGKPGETGELSEEDKKAKAEYDEKVAKRDKVLKTNEVVALSFKEGNQAFEAKNYDLAIAKYEAGIAADPDFMGSVPVLNLNRAKALMSKASDTFNASFKIEDATEKMAERAKARKGLADAAEGFLRAFNMLKTPPPVDVMDKARYDSVKLSVLNGAIETFQKAVRIEQVDQGTIDTAKILIPEYLSIETDPAKKRAASLALGDLYRVVGDSENAIAAYKKIMETAPDDVDALSGAGFSLINLGYVNNDKAQLQEGANLLQKFASLAPDTNKYKADAVGLLETLKKEQNVAPQKVPAGGKKR